MTASELHEAMRVLSEIITRQEWDRLPEILHDDVVFEYPQSGERFRGVANVKAQFENYPDLDPGGSELTEVIGEDAYALTPSYTVIRVEGSGAQGTAVIRVRYPDDSRWWAINLFEVRDGRIVRSRSYFAPDFEAPEWRAPFREAP
jgi:ketosteroid isomerase-like protein